MSNRSRVMRSVSRDDGRFLRLMVEISGARNVVELGTSHGYSALWMALALQKRPQRHREETVRAVSGVVVVGRRPMTSELRAALPPGTRMQDRSPAGCINAD